MSASLVSSISLSDFDAFVGRALRCAAARAGLIPNAIATAGTALAGGFVDGKGALELLAETPGALALVAPSSSPAWSST